MSVIIATLQSILDYTFLNNQVWRWAALFGVLLLTLWAARIGSAILQAQIKRMQNGNRLELIRMVLASATGATRMIIFAGGFYLAQVTLSLDAHTRALWIKSSTAVAALGMAWFIFRLMDVVEHLLRRWMPATESMLQEPVVALIRKTLRVLIILVAAIFIAQNIFEWRVDGLIAGITVSGVAVALAAQSSLANIFGCLMIFADRPFALGDRVKVQGYDGVVREVNFRSTKIRTADGHWITIPNALIAKDTIENVERRLSIRKVMNLALAYDTPPEKVQRAVEILRGLLAARSANFPPDQPATVFFADFNRDNLGLVATFWYVPADGAQYFEFCHELNLEILQRFNAEGIGFALPAQTLQIQGERPAPMATSLADKPVAERN